ncbi:hypothetical protein JIN84_21525 [Luteolibacter yonseiensis]|uniref:Uncharacterized protein n=1 Tax=Luteolibacter yonseiensis TaxID=1144680 RepID=A0A934R756_9BACT|nr:hypothetical protein [Luteolibacter yonseiensis]MBK1818219.1 hypothetical protein [Luteolibacter yonseiensis]
MTHTEAREFLRRADQISDRLEKTRDLRVLATIISESIVGEVATEWIRFRPTEKTSDQDSLPSWARPSEGEYVSMKVRRELSGPLILEDYISELIATHVSPVRPATGAKRLDHPSFAFFVGGISCLQYETHDSEILIKCISVSREQAATLAAAAVAAVSPETLRNLAEGIEFASNENNHNKLSRHIAFALQARRNLADRGVETPTKSDIRQETSQLLKAIRLEPYDAADSSKWRLVFNSSGMHDLPQGRPGRGKALHGA